MRRDGRGCDGRSGGELDGEEGRAGGADAECAQGLGDLVLGLAWCLGDGAWKVVEAFCQGRW